MSNLVYFEHGESCSAIDENEEGPGFPGDNVRLGRALIIRTLKMVCIRDCCQLRQRQNTSRYFKEQTLVRK